MANISTTFTSGYFFTDLGTTLKTPVPIIYDININFVGSTQLNIGVYGPTNVSSFWVSGSFFDNRGYNINVILPLTSVSYVNSTSDYWLS